MRPEVWFAHRAEEAFSAEPALAVAAAASIRALFKVRGATAFRCSRDPAAEGWLGR